MDDGRNQLFREYVRLLQGLRQKVFVMENVSGMVKGKMKVISAGIVREIFVGVRQNRTGSAG
jgi:DNA (cytosine-5)-methyltransferase 1